MLFLPTMKMVTSFLLILFLTFLAIPTVVTFVDEKVDISMAFTANEEENTSKNQIVFEFTLQDSNHHTISIHFLQEQSVLNPSYKEGYRLVFLDVLSPPPRQA